MTNDSTLPEENEEFQTADQGGDDKEARAEMSQEHQRIPEPDSI